MTTAVEWLTRKALLLLAREGFDVQTESGRTSPSEEPRLLHAPIRWYVEHTHNRSAAAVTSICSATRLIGDEEGTA